VPIMLPSSLPASPLVIPTLGSAAPRSFMAG
jgi:hypothetical protein